MKLIIDIPEDELTEDEIEEAKRIADDCFCGVKTIITDNATNGDVIKAVFPNVTTELGIDKVIFARGLNNVTPFSEDWWNAPYQKGGKE